MPLCQKRLYSLLEYLQFFSGVWFINILSKELSRESGTVPQRQFDPYEAQCDNPLLCCVFILKFHQESSESFCTVDIYRACPHLKAYASLPWISVKPNFLHLMLYLRFCVTFLCVYVWVKEGDVQYFSSRFLESSECSDCQQ